MKAAPPCGVCGYNGPGYYQTDTHPCFGNPNYRAQTDAELIERVESMIDNAQSGDGKAVIGKWLLCAIRDRLQALSTTPGDERAERYRHKARGTEYDLIGTAELQDASGAGVEEGALLAVYRGDDGKLWARRHKEFGDGRFERIAALSEHPPSSVMKELVPYRDIALAALQRGRQAGESQEMIARWIAEDIRSALSRVQLPSVLMDNVDVKG